MRIVFVIMVASVLGILGLKYADNTLGSDIVATPEQMAGVDN
ncbi:hypothetical protein [Endobacterium cereale]|jgi:hypothetical protein|nr:hypothetical protein [Endobacterium cereale]MEB2843170.1 hypothetical protein [Endobacterium cereale]